jgi:sRNA-binding carbon storage regulator CsrA
MLTLQRKEGEAILIDHDIRVVYLGLNEWREAKVEVQYPEGWSFTFAKKEGDRMIISANVWIEFGKIKARSATIRTDAPPEVAIMRD